MHSTHTLPLYDPPTLEVTLTLGLGLTHSTRRAVKWLRRAFTTPAAFRIDQGVELPCQTLLLPIPHTASS
jgi:hypothetical protein